MSEAASDTAVMDHPVFLLFAGGLLSQVTYKAYSGIQYSGIPENVVWWRYTLGLSVLFVLVVIAISKFG